MSGPTIERSELIVLACKAGASVGRWGDAVFTRAELTAFYRLAYAAGQDAEREACVQVINDIAVYGKVFRRIGEIRTPAMNALRLAIDFIRARGQK